MNENVLSSFGDWQLQQSLGTGGFGEVSLWKNKHSNLEIATKRLRVNHRLSADEVEKLKQRWTQEYQWMRELNTQFIVRGVDVQDESFIAYLNAQHSWLRLPVIVMEYCNGGDLRSQLQKTENLNGLSEHEVRSVLHALRNAVEYLHTVCRIEHRDIKPDNIVIQQQPGQPICYKLTDFGFARNCTENTIIKSVVGTRHYFAPEVVDTALYTNTVDYWSVGIIAHELMCGRLPFIPHQELFQIIVNIKKKPKACIAIEEDLEQKNRYHFRSQMCQDHGMSRVFLAKMEKWLEVSLDTNYKTRGTLAGKLCFYSMLDEILEMNILTVFCMNTYGFYSYPVHAEQSIMELLEAMEKDTQLPRISYYFVYPTGHPNTPFSAATRPLDIFVPSWQEQATANPPVMLYLVGYQCNLKAADPRISPLMKRCLSFGSSEALPPSWQLERLSQETHFLLSSEHRHLVAFLSGLKEYAMTVEHDIMGFAAQVEDLMMHMWQLAGQVQQFTSMVKLAEEAHAQGKSQSAVGIFHSWHVKTEAMKNEIQKVDVNLAQSVKKRYNSVLRRAKEQATSKLYDEFIQSDMFGLQDFRAFLASKPHKSEARELFDVCRKTIYSCLEQRNAFLSNKQVQRCRSAIGDVHEEFRKITKIVNDALKYCGRFREQIQRSTYDFHVQLVDNISVKMGVNGSRAESMSMQVNGLSASLENILQLPTSALIEEALQRVELMTVDCEDGGEEIPRTISLM